MAKERVPATPKPSAHSAIRTAWLNRKKEAGAEDLSLKTFAQHHALSPGSLGEKCKNWFFNKRENFSKLPLGIGSTRRSAKKGDKKN